MAEETARYKIQALNVNSIAKIHKRHFLANYIKLHKPDVLLLSETCLHKRHKVQFDGYEMVRNDMSPGNRGTAILVKQTLKFRTFRLNIETNFEYTAISLFTAGSAVFVFSIYVHSNQLSSSEDLSRVFDCFGPDVFLLLGGDFNAKHHNWLNYNNNSNGLIVNSFITCDQHFRRTKLISSSRPTRFASNSFSFIDFFLISSNINSDQNARTYPFESDHLAIEIFIEIPCIETSDSVPALNFNRTNWSRVNKMLACYLQENLPPSGRNMSGEQIEDHVRFLEETVLQIVTENTPIMKMHPNYSLELNQLTLKCIQEKKMLRRRWFRTGRNDMLLKSFINRLTKIISELIAVQYNQKLEKEFLNLKPGPRIFKEIRRFSGGKKSQPPILLGCVDYEDSAERLATHFASVHNLSPAATAANDECPPNRAVDDLLNSDVTPLINFSDDLLADGTSSFPEHTPFVSVATVESLVKTRKNQKSKGESQISNFIIRKLNKTFILYLTILINQSLNSSYFPKRWKHATVVPVPKGCSCTTNHNLYRPISLLSPLSKIYELVIKQQLNGFVESLSAFNPYQFGFVSGRSTSHAITLLSEDIHDASSRKTPTLAVTIDLQKAFDSVWINGLIFKLKLLNFPVFLIRIILMFLTGRSFQVKFRDKLSSRFCMRAGVPQGSILGPILFNLYMSDFPTYHNSSISTIFFADDIFLYISRKHIPTAIANLNQYLKLISEYFDLWKLKVNYGKCYSILFRKSDTHIPKACKKFKICDNLKVVFNSHQIKNVPNIKYLGVLLNNKLSAIPQVKGMCTLARAAFSCLWGIFRNPKISINVKILAYKQLIRPLLMYGFPGWCHISSNQMKKIRSIERSVLYKCLPRNVAFTKVDNNWRHISRKLLYKEIASVRRIDTVLVKNFVKFFEKMEFLDIEKLSSLTSLSVLAGKFIVNPDRYKYKCFPPSMLYFCHSKKSIYENDCLRFYNRRYNSERMEDYVYDLVAPD